MRGACSPLIKGWKTLERALADEDFISLPSGSSLGLPPLIRPVILQFTPCKSDIEDHCRRDEPLSGLIWTCWTWCAICASTIPGQPWTALCTSCPRSRTRAGTPLSYLRRAPGGSWSTRTAVSWRMKRSVKHQRGAPWWPAAHAAVALKVWLAPGLSTCLSQI